VTTTKPLIHHRDRCTILAISVGDAQHLTRRIARRGIHEYSLVGLKEITFDDAVRSQMLGTVFVFNPSSTTPRRRPSFVAFA
jgi:hypothetical protein